MSANEKTPGMLIARLDRIPVGLFPVSLRHHRRRFSVHLLRHFRHQRLIHPNLHPDCSQLHTHSAANYIGMPVLLDLSVMSLGP